MVLKIIGGWEQLKATVNAYRFLDAGPDGDPLGQEDLPAAMNKLAKKFRLRWPHDRFAAKVHRCNQVRQKFAHFLFVSAIVGVEPPNRTLYFTSLGTPAASFKAERNSLGLEWLDEGLVRQSRHEDWITEQELRDTLAELKELIDWCHALGRIVHTLKDSPDLPDDHPIDTPEWVVPWRTEKASLLALRDIRLGDEAGASAP
ncbi:hypothetical protein [Mycobacterium montefiorense]|uniref:Uncharacterized protein n=1 Tax=Mycobacterium montefiorense TaxID=154654 RepID=A0AA37Q0A0_9MYCO|nr:hypothetical protein [Mycobacterium montefiorense]GBG36767.1 hypothetical protein MmonteBS_11390 [Mycobacterium montefiorense]GKU37527.1 hypothetical protein NJB14191_48730 [Mycobacterium montefiorense]GKU42605.1 hypothetical protein NJB14192_45880 [Mycobacterium montefiorense]GKU48717.1 hypothetical protein NJB14194_53320 [Mycobacterium montefiorense]GKU50742.1 hypothetical protein NJB14195_19880 [Mycobacterium montefiorense]